MSSLSFLHLASANKKISTGHIVSNIRKYHPDAYYFLGSDAADDLSEIAATNNCDYVYYTNKIGYPSYKIEKVISWLERFRYACEKSNTTHIMMVEDDVWIKKPVTVLDEWEMSCHHITHGNEMPPQVIDLIENFSGKRPLTNYYGGGGGSIYKVDTFLNNYERVLDWFKTHHNDIQSYYEPFGFMDCYMVAYYMLCGKDYNVNPYMTDTHHHRNNGFDWDEFVETRKENIEIVNNYKKYYWV
jgi:hypothetical protein